MFRPWTKGKKNIPKKGGVIFAPNHNSFIDSIFLPLVVKRRITFLAKIDYWRGSGIKGFVSKMFFFPNSQKKNKFNHLWFILES